MDSRKFVLFKSNMWLRWAVATAGGFFISDFFSFLVGSQFANQICALLAILVAGFSIGTLQWLIALRSSVEKSNPWMWYSTMGWAIGWVIGNLFDSILPLSLFVHGTILGLIQWFFFIRNIYPKSFSWVLANNLGLPTAYILSWNVIFPILSIVGYDGTLSGPADSIVRGFLFGAITGVNFMWLSSRLQKNTESAIENIE